jgi:UDP-perosamine 4-acetyltransferase
MARGLGQRAATATVGYCCVGGGGHAKVVIDAALACGFTIAGVLDRAAGAQAPFALPILGSDADYRPLLSAGRVRGFIFGLGGIDHPSMQRRRSVFLGLASVGGEMPAIVHPQATLSGETTVGAGSFVNRAAAINAGVRLGRNVIVNTGAVVDHDCQIGDHAHIAPGATLSGGVEIGEATLIGVGAVVIQGRRIGAGAIVGAGAVVVDDVPPATLVIGLPARPVRDLMAVVAP